MKTDHLADTRAFPLWELIGRLRTVFPHREVLNQLIVADKNLGSYSGLLDGVGYRAMLETPNYRATMRLVRATLAYMDEIDAVTKTLKCE